ncbi:hypothetical protein D4758_10200 [Enterocloster citroniae]|nr:hypothetical protein [Enterocloster citroniae]RGC10956.1 hypothetical protein DWZ14_12370 [Enterocloster citroniae]
MQTGRGTLLPSCRQTFLLPNLPFYAILKLLPQASTCDSFGLRRGAVCWVHAQAPVKGRFARYSQGKNSVERGNPGKIVVDIFIELYYDCNC